jgi:hypothetical protein
MRYAPRKFKHVSLTAKYQYGEQPHTFNRVDHLFNVGFTPKTN